MRSTVPSRLSLKLVLFVGLWIGVSFWSSSAEAAEQRCNELGANCVCARSLAATSWVAMPGLSGFWRESNQNTADSKLCGYNYGGSGYAAIWDQSDAAPQATSGLNGYGALLDNMTNGAVSIFPSDQQRSVVSGRIGIRYYIKLGSGYQSTGDGACSNDKYTQIGDYLTAYGTGFTTSNGGGFPSNVTPSMMIGKWWRIEHYLDSYTNPTTHTFFMKNVTDNQPEQSFSVPARLAADRAALTGFTDVIHKYKAGSCGGSATMMFAMMAHWSTNAGQRIGAATELENGSGGGGGDTVPPATPTGLTAR